MSYPYSAIIFAASFSRVRPLTVSKSSCGRILAGFPLGAVFGFGELLGLVNLSPLNSNYLYPPPQPLSPHPLPHLFSRGSTASVFCTSGFFGGSLGISTSLTGKSKSIFDSTTINTFLIDCPMIPPPIRSHLWPGLSSFNSVYRFVKASHWFTDACLM